jgi:hypothetical protein
MTNNPVPMKPFYALVFNQTGERLETCSSDILNDCMPFWEKYISAGTHRIVHIPGENASGWRSIEGAPRDGTQILATDGQGFWVCSYIRGKWDDGDWLDNIEGLTHWMPIPAAPNTDAPPVATAQSALVDELRRELREARTTISLNRTDIMSEIRRGNDRWEGVPEILKARLDSIDAILSKFGGRE